jgi:hypothetical protein
VKVLVRMAVLGSVIQILDSFTPYDELTKEQVVGWVKNALGEEQVTSVEESLANQIQQKLDPTDASGVPW